MANIKSQIKRNRQNETARARNRKVRSALKTEVRRFHTAVDGGDKDEAQSSYVSAARALDKAASKGVLHRNTAANKKSGMAKRLNALEG
ncbi:MAG: 30S ribosomal protein S20 [Nitriliruptoraceae bacterium]|nr:30S ribosomal protein S20 [Nitriliruptoraceae bacterium]